MSHISCVMSIFRIPFSKPLRPSVSNYPPDNGKSIFDNEDEERDDKEELESLSDSDIGSTSSTGSDKSQENYIEWWRTSDIIGCLAQKCFNENDAIGVKVWYKKTEDLKNKHMAVVYTDYNPEVEGTEMKVIIRGCCWTSVKDIMNHGDMVAGIIIRAFQKKEGIDIALQDEIECVFTTEENSHLYNQWRLEKETLYVDFTDPATRSLFFPYSIYKPSVLQTTEKLGRLSIMQND